MPKVEVAYDRFFPQFTHSLNHGGALLVSLDSENRPNAMTIGWGMVGVIWGKPIFAALVRPSRFTYGCIEATGDFTVCVPYADLAEEVLFCGTESGRGYDKFAECKFAALPSAAVKSPGIEQCGLIYECAVVHRNDVIPAELTDSIVHSCYPAGDFHRIYFGEILRVVADEDFEARLTLA